MSEPTISEYFRKKQLIERLSKELQALEESETVKRKVAIESDIKVMLDKYDMSAIDLIESIRALYDVDGEPAFESGVYQPAPSGGEDARGSVDTSDQTGDSSPASVPGSTGEDGPRPGKPVTRRRVKIYTNPDTGESVRTRGSNHRTLNLWRQRYGREIVDTWWKFED